jgi:hypothetical protein
MSTNLTWFHSLNGSVCGRMIPDGYWFFLDRFGRKTFAVQFGRTKTVEHNLKILQRPPLRQH